MIFPTKKRVRYQVIANILLRANASIVYTNPYTYGTQREPVSVFTERTRRRVSPNWNR